MTAQEEPSPESAGTLNRLLFEAGLHTIPRSQEALFGAYLSLLLRWNARINLTAVRDAEGIQSRHFAESIACAQLLPDEIDSLLDYGSGAGFPGIPIAICRPEIAVTLAESQSKKAAFLQEAARTLDLAVQVFPHRAEDLSESFSCVILRAVDRMELAVASAVKLVRPGGLLAVLTTITEYPALRRAVEGHVEWLEPRPLPGATQRILAVGKRIHLPADPEDN